MSLTTQRQDNVVFSSNVQSFSAVINFADFVILILGYVDLKISPNVDMDVETEYFN